MTLVCRSPRWPPRRCAALLVLSLGSGLPAVAGESPEIDEPRQRVVVLDEECLECSVALVEGWSYRPGDDPAWADPELDDSAWLVVEPALRSMR